MKRILFILLILSANFLYAEDIVSLKQLIEVGLEQNFQIRMVRNEQKISDNNLSTGNAGYLPTVDLNASYRGGHAVGQVGSDPDPFTVTEHKPEQLQVFVLDPAADVVQNTGSRRIRHRCKRK